MLTNTISIALAAGREWIRSKSMTREEIKDFCDMKVGNIYKNGKKRTKKGHWVIRPHVYGVTYCSECDFELKIDNTNFCPNCGADMRGKECQEKKS